MNIFSREVIQKIIILIFCISGITLLNSRYYNPDIGRFITADPVNLGNYLNIQGLNRYSYCKNNPINRVDPTGYKDEYFFTIYVYPPIIGSEKVIRYNPLRAIKSFDPLKIFEQGHTWIGLTWENEEKNILKKEQYGLYAQNEEEGLSLKYVPAKIQTDELIRYKNKKLIEISFPITQGKYNEILKDILNDMEKGLSSEIDDSLSLKFNIRNYTCVHWLFEKGKGIKEVDILKNGSLGEMDLSAFSLLNTLYKTPILNKFLPNDFRKLISYADSTVIELNTADLAKSIQKYKEELNKK